MDRNELIEAILRSKFATYFDETLRPFSDTSEATQSLMREGIRNTLEAIEAQGLAIVPVEFPETKFDENDEPTDIFQKTWSKAHKDSVARYGKPAFASYTFFSKLWKPMIEAGKV